jgi:hypothetical protein
VITKLLAALALMATCVVLHATGLTTALRWLKSALPSLGSSYGRQLRLLIAVAGWTVLIHLVEIAVWAVYYAGGGGMPDLDSALYFSAVTYTTTGYGDLVLPVSWRMVGGIEALTGILMCGWSTGFFFAIVSQIFMQDAPAPPASPGAGGA